MEKHIESIKEIMDKLLSCMESQLNSGTENVDTKEAGYVIDMIKDLADASYHVTLVKAMEESEYGEDYDEYGLVRYYTQPKDSKGRYMRRRYTEPYYRMTPEMYEEEHKKQDADSRRFYTEMTHTDPMMGKAGMSRKSYVEAKSMHPEDTQMKMQKLEDYMRSMSDDLSELVDAMTPQEKTIVRQKLTTLKEKI